MEWSSLLSPLRMGKHSATDVNPMRSAFEKDFDRIVFSHPFRSLQDKTQVHPLPEYDFVHTRLTHSLEVSSIGRSLGKKAGEAILKRHPGLSSFSPSDFGAIVAAASLAHDVGNPPFGHPGERCISDFFIDHPQGQRFKTMLTEAQWEDMIRFEGNAQGFRILTKTRYQGLRLTYSTLGAFTKYPCASHIHSRDTKKVSQKKYGFFQSELPLFKEVASRLALEEVGANTWARHPLAFLMEAADDICYHVIDLEDGCRLGLVGFDETVKLLADILKERFSQEKLENIKGQNEKISALRALVIDQLINECSDVFVEHEEAILANRFDRELAELCPSTTTLKEIKKVSMEKIYRTRNLVEVELGGLTALSGLLEEFTLLGQRYLEKKMSGRQEALMELLPVETTEAMASHNDDPYLILRNIIDFVSSMTDRYALSLYSKIRAYPNNGRVTGY